MTFIHGNEGRVVNSNQVKQFYLEPMKRSDETFIYCVDCTYIGGGSQTIALFSKKKDALEFLKNIYQEIKEEGSLTEDVSCCWYS